MSEGCELSCNERIFMYVVDRTMYRHHSLHPPTVWISGLSQRVVHHDHQLQTPLSFLKTPKMDQCYKVVPFRAVQLTVLAQLFL